MSHITIIISSKAVQPPPEGEAHSEEGNVQAVECSYIVPHGKTDVEVGREVAQLLKQIKKLAAT